MEQKKYYRPLPDCLKIGDSEIEGNGLFAKENISKGTCLGLSHVFNLGFIDGYIRTPLGGFINYSDEPNCETSDIREGQVYFDENKNLYIWTIRDLKKGDELTLKYILYNPTI